MKTDEIRKVVEMLILHFCRIFLLFCPTFLFPRKLMRGKSFFYVWPLLTVIRYIAMRN